MKLNIMESKRNRASYEGEKKEKPMLKIKIDMDPIHPLNEEKRKKKNTTIACKELENNMLTS